MPRPWLRRRLGLGLGLILAPVLPRAAWAEAADVIGVAIRRNADGSLDLDVTIRSADTGWQRYADRFEVLAPDGRVLGMRELLHPHEDEQPFTRELTGLRLPAGVTEIVVRAHMKGVGYDGATRRVAVPAR